MACAGECINGHILVEVGQDKNGHCKVCMKSSSDKYRARVGLKTTLAAQCRKVGITVGQYESLDKQCCLCGTVNPGTHRGNWCKDHNHTTGQFRGLLCRVCNIRLGYYEIVLKDQAWKTKADRYL